MSQPVTPSNTSGIVRERLQQAIFSQPARAKLRLWTGLILLFFATTHLLSHAAGNLSYAALARTGDFHDAVWRSLPGTMILYGALVIHAGLAVAKTLGRRTFRIPISELLQLVLGLSIPVFAAEHLFYTRLSAELVDAKLDYQTYLSIAWPWAFWKQTALVVVVWIHGMIGFHLWLRHKRWYAPWRPWLFSVAVAIPLLSATGWTTAGKELVLTGKTEIALTNEQINQLAVQAELTQQIAFAGFLLCFLFPVGVMTAQRLKSSMTVAYVGDRQIRTAPGPTLLEISRANNIAHTSICGGRARCSTCRVRVVAGIEQLPPPDAREAAVLKQIQATADVRLACQIRPARDISVIRLVQPRVRNVSGSRTDMYRWGVEQPVIVMFTDLRGFTRFSEKRLPYDVLFVLNAYLESAAERIVRNNGLVDKFMGDGIMALFGVDRSFEQASRDALRAAVALQQGMDTLNAELKLHLDEPLKLVVAIHGGPAIIGQIGRVDNEAPLTALGDTVNTASRLEGVVKQKDARIVVSRRIVEAAGLSIDDIGERDEAPIRGREELEEICLIYDIDALAGSV